MMNPLKMAKALVKSKKGLAALAGLPTAVIFLAVAGLTIAFGVLILTNIGTNANVGAGSDAQTAINNSITGAKNISSQFGSLGYVIIAFVIIAVLVGGFIIGRKR